MAQELTDDQVIEQAMVALRNVAGQPEPERKTQYSLFLGSHQAPYDNDVHDKPGFARNSLYNKLPELIRNGMSPGEAWVALDRPDGARYYALCQTLRVRGNVLKKRLVDQALAEGVLRIEPVDKHAVQGQGLS